MALSDHSLDKHRIFQDFQRHEEEVITSLCRLNERPPSPKEQMEQEKKIRREIANSNERRRMQSINAGFQSLKTLLPHNDGEKLSKAAILQQTSEYIFQLEKEKTRLLTQNCQLRRLVNNQFGHDSDGGSSADSPLPKRKKMEAAESSDEGIGNMSPYEGDSGTDDLKREMIELRMQLDKERRLRLQMEEQMRNTEAEVYPDQMREIAHHVTMQYDDNRPSDDLSSQEDGNLQLMSPRSTTMLPSIVDSSSSGQDSDEPQDLSTNPDERKGQPCLSSLPCSLSVSSAAPPVSHLSPLPLSVSTANSTISIPLPHDRQSHSPSSIKAHLTSTGRLEIEIPIPSQILHPVSTSRQNLETIVEAIRHLEGDHMFQDDPKPDSKSNPSFSTEEISFRNPIIQCSSAVTPQSRPGVIVATHS